LQLIRVIGTHTPSKLASKRKQGVIIIDDSDSEGEDEVLVTPTKRPWDPVEEDFTPNLKAPRTDSQPRRRFDQDLEPDIGLRRDVKPYVGLGRYVKPKTGIGRDAKATTARRGAISDVKPVLTAMGEFSVSPVLSG
jgi:hypothetical protein